MEGNIKELKQNKEIADSVAKERGYDSINELVTDVNSKLSSKNPATKMMGERIAASTVEDLLLLCLYQEIEGTDTADYIKFANRFDDGYIASGNSKEYVVNNDTGHDTYTPTMFIPSSLTTTNVDKYTIQMYDSKNQLNSKAYQFKKQKTFIEPNWLPYFKEGKLAVFIMELREEIRRSYYMFKFDKIAKLITTSTPQTTVEGTAPNLFDAMNQEVLPLLRELTTYTNKYNYQETTHINVLKPEDMILIANGEIIQQLNSGIKSQLFNAKFFDFKNIIGEENIVNLGNQLQISDGNTAVSVIDSPYVDKNTIYILDKSAIKHILQIDRYESQSFAHNLALTLVLHVWGAMDILPWKVFFKYHNTNLSTLPN